MQDRQQYQSLTPDKYAEGINAANDNPKSLSSHSFLLFENGGSERRY
jgi:hypothetical protein